MCMPLYVPNMTANYLPFLCIVSEYCYGFPWNSTNILSIFCLSLFAFRERKEKTQCASPLLMTHVMNQR